MRIGELHVSHLIGIAVSAALRNCHADARRRLSGCRRFIGEEQVSETGVMPELTDEPTWMCDPLDGALVAAQKLAQAPCMP